MPDLLGWDAEKAIEKLNALGIQWTIDISRPPKNNILKGYYRIIKQNDDGGTCRLTLSKVADDFR